MTPGEDLRQQWRITAYNSWYFRAEVETAANGVFVQSEAFYPGWKAYLDGREVPIMRADYALRAVELPAGRHVLEIRYVPLNFWAGLLVSLLTLMVIAAIVVYAPGGKCLVRRRSG